MSQAGIVDFEGANPQVPTTFETDENPAIPILNVLEILGETVSNSTYAKPVFTTGSGNTVTINTQVSTESLSSDINLSGLSSFDSAAFNVDENGFVTLTGGGGAISKFTVDSSTAPGVNPVTPTALGNVSISGDVVSNHGVVLETHSRALNEYNIEIQQSAALAAPSPNNSGVSHFNSAQFTVNNGFVSTSGSGVGNTITGDNLVALPPTSGNWDIFGSHGINTSGADSTLTVAINNAITLGDLSVIASGSNAISCTTGDINIAAGDLKLPSTNSALTEGVISQSGSSLRIHTYGNTNTFIGSSAGNGTLSGANNNVGIGLNSLSALTSGDQNVGVGDNCLRNVTSGGNNVGFGTATLTTLSTSSSNSFFGHGGGNLISTGSGRNTGCGTQTLNKVTTGTDNTALGYQAGFTYTGTESNNILIGSSVLGTLGESGVTRIGASQSACYIDGIDGVNVGSVATVVTEAGDKLGTAVITAGSGITVTPGANTITIAAPGSTTDYHDSRYIVSTGGSSDGANYTTIASAYAAAVAATGKQTVFVQPGTYTENITLTSDVDICAHACDSGYIQNNSSGTANVKIIGKLTANDLSGSVTLSGLWLETNSDYAVTITGTLLTRVCLNGCTIIAANNTALNNSNSNAASRFVLNYCCGDIQTNGYAIFTLSNGSTSGNLNMNYCNFSNSGDSTTANTLASGSYAFINHSHLGKTTTSDTSGLDCVRTTFRGVVTTNGTAVTRFTTCNFTTDTSGASCLSIGAGVTANVTDSTFESTNATSVITGAGTLKYSGLNFYSTGSSIDVTTQTPMASSNDIYSVVTPGAYPYTVKPQDAMILVDTSSARTINLEASPATGIQHIIKDNVGSAGTNNITVTPAAGNIDGVASYTININYGSITARYNGTQWNVI